MPHRPLVWADNENRTRKHCQHQPQGRGRVSRMFLTQKFVRQPLLLLCTALLPVQHSKGLFWFLQVSVQDFTYSVSFSPLFCLVWMLKLLIFTWFQRISEKKISVGWTNVAEAPQKVHKLFTKLARASILLPQCLKTTCLLSHFIRRLLHSSSTDIAARTFWSYWLACLFCLFSNKKNHMH